MPLLKDPLDEIFAFGKGRVITEGSDVGIIATGEAVYPALQAAERLRQQHVNATVVSMHTVKPLDTPLLETLADRCKAILTVEEHSEYGGLGEACASYLMQAGKFLQFKIMGIPDEYTITGSQQEIFNHYGISSEGIANAALRLLKK